jgi:hypothetical protein
MTARQVFLGGAASLVVAALLGIYLIVAVSPAIILVG